MPEKRASFVANSFTLTEGGLDFPVLLYSERSAFLKNRSGQRRLKAPFRRELFIDLGQSSL